MTPITLSRQHLVLPIVAVGFVAVYETASSASIVSTGLWAVLAVLVVLWLHPGTRSGSGPQASPQSLIAIVVAAAGLLIANALLTPSVRGIDWFFPMAFGGAVAVLVVLRLGGMGRTGTRSSK